MTPRVVAAGLVTLDVVQAVAALPRSNHKQVATGLEVDFGGPAANAAGVAAGLGVRAELVAAIGTGPVARAVSTYLRAAGVEAIDLAPSVDRAFGVSTVLVEPSGERSVVSTNAREVPLELAVGVRRLAGADALLVDGHRMDLCLAMAQAAREAGVPVILDGGSWKPGTDQLVRFVDVAVVSADFHPPVSSVAELMRGAGVFAFGQSRGDEAWELEVAGVRSRIDVPRVDVVDTLGAGDVLHGALLAAVARLGIARGDLSGRAAEVVAAARYASRVASLSCAASGARGWLARDLPSWATQPA
ncbi:PfkB family carbohydrate kinase [Ammonicoccus fulvus]|uniref:PfkB family carbohydrate kinase n=1 Tax=Ammonicoccus fulvus TaxID=3138240 RepID=A0ABZ3FL37_9ACTN